MKVGLLWPENLPESFQVYLRNVVPQLQQAGVDIRTFASRGDRPSDVDLYWDPRSGGGHPPHESLDDAPVPVVVTVHGVATMAIPLREYFQGWRACVDGWWSNRQKRRAWQHWQGRWQAIIAVSEYGKQSTVDALNLDPSKIYVCPHGVSGAFSQAGHRCDNSRGYFLHVSNNEPRKNVARIVAAYQQLPSDNRPDLVLKLSGKPKLPEISGLRLITEHLPDNKLIELYSHAIAFVFPSLYEGFGLPILEAMATGCPVITSQNSACSEVAGNAALLVDPRRTADISAAMAILANDPIKRQSLIKHGVDRLELFSWERSGQQHLAVFQQLIK